MKIFLFTLMAIPSLCFGAVKLEVNINDPATFEAFENVEQTPKFHIMTRNIESAYNNLRQNEIKQTGTTKFPEDLIITIDSTKSYKFLGKYEVKYISEKLSRIDMNTAPNLGFLKIFLSKDSVKKEGGAKLMEKNFEELFEKVLKNINDHILESQLTTNDELHYAFRDYEYTAKKVYDKIINLFITKTHDLKVNDAGRNAQTKKSTESEENISIDCTFTDV